MQADDLQGFQCAELHVSYKYKYKHIKATVANLPQAKDATAQTSTKVRRSPVFLPSFRLQVSKCMASEKHF